MRIIITESQFERFLIAETKQSVISDEKLGKAKNIVNKLVSRGFSIENASAMAGNMWAESKFDSSAESGNGAIGLIQWLGDRKKALVSLANYKGISWSNEDLQLDFIKIELKDGYKLDNGKFIPNLDKDIKSSNKYEVNNFKNVMKADTIQKKAVTFAKDVERCGSCDGTIDIRKESAKRIHDYVVGKYKPTVKKSNSVSDKKETKGSHSIGSVIYPKKDGDGYANVRQKPNRDSDRVAKIVSPNKIGTISEIKADDSGVNWYKVILDKKIDGQTTGWVRSDVVQ